MSKACPKRNEQSKQTNINETKVKKGNTMEVIDDRDISDAETEQTAVETKKTNKCVDTVRVNRTKLMPNDVVKAIGALSSEERDTVLDAIMMQNEDF
jgi:hypothetical protein